MNNTIKGNKRINSTKKYIDKLSEQYSKLNIVRVDLAYKKPHSDTTTLDKANEDFSRMLNNRRSKPTIFENQVGYVCKREYTEDRGVHYHAMFIYDGQKIQKDSYKAEQIGEYWNNEITKGKGSYHNCNKDKSSYVQNGIGMLDHKDKDKREILDKNVIPYLCKDDNNQSIAPISNSNNKRDREFVRGTIPKSKSNVGRPRSE